VRKGTYVAGGGLTCAYAAFAFIREISSVTAALKHLRAVTDYVSRNKLEAWREEAELASQLADLLEQKMAMLQALAAREQARR
jgi:hypothetical protein